jgi:signal transduction histidine kinase
MILGVHLYINERFDISNLFKGRYAMATKSTDASMPFLNVGKEQTDAMLRMQKELLDAYEQASRAWLARVKSEVDLWSELATKLTGTHSTSEAMGAYQECVAKRMQMAAEDGRRLSDDCQKVMQMITRSMSNGWPTTAAGT